MTRRVIPWASGAAMATALLAGLPPEAAAQYAVRGGPMYGGPIGGGPTGPTLFTGAYAPSFYTGPLPGAYSSPGGPGAGAGLMPNYVSSFPYYGGGYTSAPIAVPVPFPQPTYYQQPYVYNPPPVKPLDNGTYPGPNTSPRTRPSPTPGAGPAEGSRSSPIEPVAPAMTGQAHFGVRLPADAKLWVNDALTQQSGTSRRFHTPADLDAAQTYEYTFRAQWAENGQTVTRDKTQRFKAGDDLTVDFTQAGR